LGCRRTKEKTVGREIFAPKMFSENGWKEKLADSKCLFVSKYPETPSNVKLFRTEPNV